MICKISFGFISTTDQNDLVVLRLSEFNSKNIHEMVNLFQPEFHEQIEQLLTEFFFGDYNRLRHSLSLTTGVDILVHQWELGPDAILRAICRIKNIRELLQVFADKEVRAEITRRAFEYV